MTSRGNRPGVRAARGASAVEYILVLVLVGAAGIVAWAKLGTAAKCRIAMATSLFGGSASAACAEAGGGGGGAGGGELAMNGGGGGGPGASSVCVGGVCTSPGNCFVAGTLVQTVDGPVPIESIAAGTLVLARDEAAGDDGAPAFAPVERTFARLARSRVALTYGEATLETVEVTPEHRLRSATRGWITAGELVPGKDALVDAGGRAVPLVAAVELAGEVAVYNLEVAELHTYFVGERAVWAHNVCGKPTANGDGTYSVSNFPGLTLQLNQQLTDDFGDPVYTVVSNQYSGDSLLYEGGNYYWVGSHDDGNALGHLSEAYPPASLNNDGGKTYNYEPKPGAQTIPLKDLDGVEMRINVKDSSKLEDSMKKGVPIPPIVVKKYPDGSYEIIDGFTRLTAARNLDLEKIPVVITR